MLKTTMYNHKTKEVIEFIVRNDKELKEMIANSKVKYTLLECEKHIVI